MLQLFVDRRRELEFLEEKYREDSPQLVILYGKRRVGKTELIKRFMRNKEGSYILCTKDSVEENIGEMKRKFYELTGRRYFLRLETISFFELMRYLVEEVGDKRIIIALDEFPYLIELSPGIVSVFQKIWDELIANTKIFLILCGSSIGMMETEVLGYRSPLYGRRTAEWKVEPLEFPHIREFFPDYSLEDLIKIWSICGGTPFYLAKMDSDLTVEENIRRNILKKGEILYNEPMVIMREEFREPRVYTLILKYISMGYCTHGEISSATGMDKGNISKYLSVMEDLHIVDYILPLGKRKRGIYTIKDPFFRFWFRFVYPNLSDLEIGLVEEVFHRISSKLNQYYGEMFERLIYELIKSKVLFEEFSFTEVRRWWHKDKEIDIVALNEDARKILFAECKWKENVNCKKIVAQLAEKAKHVRWHNKSREEVYAVFAKSFSERIEDFNGKTVICFDLEDLRDKIFHISKYKNRNLD
jgi:hypothetical protein